MNLIVICKSGRRYRFGVSDDFHVPSVVGNLVSDKAQWVTFENTAIKVGEIEAIEGPWDNDAPST